ASACVIGGWHDAAASPSVTDPAASRAGTPARAAQGSGASSSPSATSLPIGAGIRAKRAGAPAIGSRSSERRASGDLLALVDHYEMEVVVGDLASRRGAIELL